MAEVFVYYTIFENENILIDEKHIRALPEIIAKEILLYKKQDDINRLTAGKYLLKKILHDHVPQVSLENYSIDAMGKPYIQGLFDFNITHSGKVVACALLNSEGSVGIDVEKIRPIEITKFTKQFSPPEMMRILSDKDPQKRFFDFWTMKEAVMKADGRGMRIPLHSIRLKEDHSTIDDKETKWNLWPLNLHESVKSCLCSNIVCNDIEIQLHPIQSLISNN